MFRLLLLASFGVAVFFIINSGFRRRLVWSIRVTLAFYAVMFAIRLVLWAVWQLFQPSTDIGNTFTAIAAIGLISAAIWVGFRYFTDRYVRRSRGPVVEARRGRRR